jgi:hypothetical protein
VPPTSITSTALANWPRLAVLLIGDFNAVLFRRVDAGRRFLASGDLALMFFHVDSCCPSPPSELAPTIPVALNRLCRYGISQRPSASFSESSVAKASGQHLRPQSDRLQRASDSDSYLLLTGRTARGFSRVSSSSCLSWRITRRSPSRSVYSTVSRPISTSSSWP